MSRERQKVLLYTCTNILTRRYGRCILSSHQSEEGQMHATAHVSVGDVFVNPTNVGVHKIPVIISSLLPASGFHHLSRVGSKSGRP